jgi:hypothetical protein
MPRLGWFGMPRRRRGLRWRRGELRWRKVGLPWRGRHALPRRSGRRPAGIRLQRREIRGRPLLGRHVGPAGDAEPDRLLRQRLPTRRAPASHGPSQIRPARTAPRGARPGIAAGVTGHRSPASIPAPGDHSPPEQDSPLEQELNGVLDDQQRICNRRRVSHPAISTRSRPPRTCVSGSGLPAAAPAPRDTRLAPKAGARTAGPKRRTSRRIYGPAGCPDGILGTTCPPPKTAANPIGARIQAESGRGLGCHGNHMPRYRNL